MKSICLLILLFACTLLNKVCAQTDMNQGGLNIKAIDNNKVELPKDAQLKLIVKRYSKNIQVYLRLLTKNVLDMKFIIKVVLIVID